MPLSVSIALLVLLLVVPLANLSCIVEGSPVSCYVMRYPFRNHFTVCVCMCVCVCFLARFLKWALKQSVMCALSELKRLLEPTLTFIFIPSDCFLLYWLAVLANDAPPPPAAAAAAANHAHAPFSFLTRHSRVSCTPRCVYAMAVTLFQYACHALTRPRIAPLLMWGEPQSHLTK